MEKAYTIVDTHLSKSGEVTTEFKETDGKMIIKQFAGVSTDNFIVKKYNGRKLEFSFFKLNGVYYVSLNGQHIVDYRKFVHIQYVSNIISGDCTDVKLKNPYFGEIVLTNCDAEVMQKSLEVMSNWMKSKRWWFSDIVYYIFS